MTYALGDMVELSFPTDGSSTTLSIWAPDGQPVAINPLSPPVGGAVSYEFVPTVPGRYRFLWRDNVGGTLQDIFTVRGISLALMSIEEMYSFLNMERELSGGELADLKSFMESATLACENHRSEKIAVRPFADVARRGRFLRERPVVRIVSAGSLDVSDWEPGGEAFAPPDEADGQLVTYYAGYPDPPTNFVDAAKIIVEHLWQIQRQPVRDSVAPDEYLTPGGLGYAIPNRAVELLGGRMPVLS